MNFWEDYYRIEEDGGVYSIRSKRYLKTKLCGAGYLQLEISINGKKKGMLVHRLVALTFIPNPDNKPEVDHIDRNKLNNHVSNLRWVTRHENAFNTKLGKLGQRYIHKVKRHTVIQFKRNGYLYMKYMNNSLSMQELIEQRDLMLSMF